MSVKQGTKLTQVKKIISLVQWNLLLATTQNAKIEWSLTGGGRLQD